MRWFLFIIAVFLCMPLVLGELSIEKQVDASYNEGEPIRISYRIENNYDSQVQVFLTDKNIMGEQGYVIECMPLRLPPNKRGVLSLARNGIDATFEASAGTYTLGNATLTYKDPQLDIIEEAHSGEHSVSVTESQQPINATGIKRINLCNKKQKKQQQQQQQKKKDQMSREEAKKKQEQEQQSIRQQQEEMQQRYQQQSDLQKKLEHTQQSMNQNTRSIKQSREEAARERRQQKRSLQKKVESSKQFKRAQQKMQKSGFREKNRSLRPSSNRSAEFDYQYENTNGSTESIHGQMENGSIEDMYSTLDMKQRLKSNNDYQRMRKRIEQQGYNATSFNAKGKNQFSQTFTDKHGNTKTLRHTADRNLSTTDRFKVSREYTKDYQLEMLEKDPRYQKIEQNLQQQGFERGGIQKQDARYVTFKKANTTERVFFSMQEQSEGWISWTWDIFRTGFEYMFGRESAP